MGFSYKHRKLRAKLRREYLEATGQTEFVAVEFLAWVEANPESAAARFLNSIDGSP